MRRFLALLVALILVACRASPDIAPTHDATPPPPPQGGTCPDGSGVWEPPVDEEVADVDLFACSQTASCAAAVSCAQTAVNAAVGSHCRAAGCCLSAGEWLPYGDHGQGWVKDSAVDAGGDGLVHPVFPVQLYRIGTSPRRGQIASAWVVVNNDGRADIATAEGAISDATTYPDGLPGSWGAWIDGGARSAWSKVPGHFKYTLTMVSPSSIAGQNCHFTFQGFTSPP